MTDNWLLKQKIKMNPIHSYERTWQRIVSALAAENTLTKQEIMYFTGWQPVYHHTLDDRPKLCTPLDRAALEREAKKRLVEELHSRPKLTIKQRFSFGKPQITESLENSHTQATQSPESRRSKELPTKPMGRTCRPLSSFYKSRKRPAVQHSKESSPSTQQIVKSISQRTYSRPFVPPANMTAYSYIVYELPETTHVCWNSQNGVQIASLTKIMTCMVSLRVASWNSENLKQTVLIGSLETNITGTTAGLEKNYWYSIEDLLYGLMLPSGNDASLALAVWAGRLIHIRNTCGGHALTDSIPPKKREAIAIFIEEMNRLAQQIGMKKTRYANTHGLSNSENKSTALDIALLCRYAMQSQMFRKVVATESYSGTALSLEGQIKQYSWSNTHRLLRKPEYLGIKTGMTTTAGACLASHLKLGCRDFIIVVLGCKHIERRFKQTEILKRWVMKKEALSKPSKEEEEDEEQVMIVDGSCEFD